MQECRQCGECCRYIKFEFDVPTKDGLDAARWISFHRNCEAIIDNGKAKIKVWSPCRHLVYDRKTSMYNCLIYEKRPDLCKMYECIYMKGTE